MSEEAKASYVAENLIQDPASPYASFTLPCGWLAPDGQVHAEVLIRAMRGSEEDILAAENVAPGVKMEQILLGCLVSLGPVSGRQQLAEIVPQLSIGDRLFLLLAIRRATLGDTYPYVAKCPACGRKDLYMADLGGLAVRPMPDPSRRVYDGVLPGGSTVRWSVMTGLSEAKALRLPAAQRKADSVTLSIAARVELIADKPVSVPQLKDLPMADRNALRDMFAEAEGGVETSLDFECPACGEAWEEELEIGQAGFFSPSAAQRAWKRKSSS